MRNVCACAMHTVAHEPRGVPAIRNEDRERRPHKISILNRDILLLYLRSKTLCKL